MLSKRTFLKRAAAATAAAAMVPVSSVASSRQGFSPRAIFDVVVFNERYADAREFARALAEHAAAVFPMEGDAGLLWYRKLRRCISGRAARIAGMGMHTDLLVLETLARDARLKVRYRCEHDCRGALTLTHRVCAGASSPQLAREITSAGCSWPTALAAALSDGPSASWSTQNPVLVCTDTARAEDHPGSLVSWVLG